MFVWTAEHVLDALDECFFGGGFVWEGVQNRLCSDGSVAAHSSAFGEELEVDVERCSDNDIEV